MFLGSRADMGDVLAAADVVLFASRSDGMEGMPAVVIEGGMGGFPSRLSPSPASARWSSMGKRGCSRLQETPTVFRSTWSVSFWTPICEHDLVRLPRGAVEPCSRSTRSHLGTSTYLRKWQAKRASLSTHAASDLLKSTRLKRIHKDGRWFIG